MFCKNIYRALRAIAEKAVNALKPAAKWLQSVPLAEKLLVCIAVAAAFVALMMYPGTPDSDYDTVAKAFEKSLRAYAAVADDLRITDFAALAQKSKFSQELEFHYKDGEEALNGAGFRARFSYNQRGKKAGFIATAFQNDTDLLTTRMKVKNNKVFFGYKELTGNSYFMIDTTSLGVDLQYRNINDYPELSFNIFSLVQQIQEAITLSRQQVETLQAAMGSLAQQIQVSQQGQRPVAVNGTELSCAIYTVTFPEGALQEYLHVAETVYLEMNYAETMESILTDAGFPLDYLNIQVDDSFMPETFSTLRRIIGNNGGLQLEVALQEGYVVSVKSTITDGFYQYTVDLQLGGGKKYADNCFLQVMERMGNGFTVTSSGNHAMAGGTFTDHTVLTTYDRHQPSEDLSWEISWKPKGLKNNFRLCLQSGNENWALEGTVRCNRKSLQLAFDSVQADGYAFAIRYRLGGYRALWLPVTEKLDYFYMTSLPSDILENYIQWTDRMKQEYYDMFLLLSELPM